MHRRPHKKDDAATKAAKFESRYSYISFRLHPGTTHQCVYLAGLDTEACRMAVYVRANGRCQYCGKRLPLNGDLMWRAHLAHGGNTKVSRCWCPENLTLKCYHCHIVVEHNREVRWSSKENAA